MIRAVIYKGTITVSESKTREVEIVGVLSEEELASLTARYQVDTNPEAMPPEIRKVTRQVGAALMASCPRMCSCGKPSTAIHHQSYVEKEGDKVIIHDLLPTFVCDDLACHTRATQNTDAILGLIAKEVPSSGEVEPVRASYMCSYCKQTKREMSLCSKCKAVYYCSKACQKKHWRAGHRDQCHSH